MTTYELKPVRRDRPECLDFGDIEHIIEFERSARTFRAYTDGYTIESSKSESDGAWKVSKDRDSSYFVDIVDRSRQHDSCTCPDFLTNRIGTCKHIEAVYRLFDTDTKLKRAYGTLGSEPRVPTLWVQGADGPRLRLAGVWTATQLAALGIRRSTPKQIVDQVSRDELKPGKHESGVRVVHAALPAWDYLCSATQRQARTKYMREAIESGQVGLNVLSSSLYPYQMEGVAHLVANGRALLADDMGLGKTVQAIAAAQVLRQRGEVRNVLIVCPASLREQWAKEIKKHCGAEAWVLTGSPRQRQLGLDSDSPYKIIGYETAMRDIHRIRGAGFELAILDEAQRAKNFRTRTAATIRGLNTDFLFVLTGTALENRLDDLYSIMQFIDTGIFGPLWLFNYHFHDQDGSGKLLRSKNLSLLRKRVAPFVLRRRKEEVLTQLPALTEVTRYVPLSDEQVQLEEEYRNQGAKLMAIARRRPLRKDEMDRLTILLMRARQACNAAQLILPESPSECPKLDEVETLCAEIAEQGTSKVLVFSEWVQMLKLAASRMDKRQIGYSLYTGEVAAHRRDAIVEQFFRDPGKVVLFCSEAGGVGLNLQAANYVIHLDLPWNPARLDQRTARAHRLGQSRGVMVTYLVGEQGIERGVEMLLARKRSLRGAALDPNSQVEEVETQSFLTQLRDFEEAFDATAGPDSGAGPDATGEFGASAMPDVAEATAEAPSPFVDMPAPSSAETPAATPEATPASVAPTPASQDAAPAPAPATQTAAPAPQATLEPSPSARPKHSAHRTSRSFDRLRLAKVVQAAGFHADAVRASYEALANAVGAVAEESTNPADHAALVAALYKTLIPTGKVPMAASLALARLRDLTLLQESGVEVTEELSSLALQEAESWIQRICTT